MFWGEDQFIMKQEKMFDWDLTRGTDLDSMRTMRIELEKLRQTHTSKQILEELNRLETITLLFAENRIKHNFAELKLSNHWFDLSGQISDRWHQKASDPTQSKIEAIFDLIVADIKSKKNKAIYEGGTVYQTAFSQFVFDFIPEINNQHSTWNEFFNSGYPKNWDLDTLGILICDLIEDPDIKDVDNLLLTRKAESKKRQSALSDILKDFQSKSKF